MRTSGIQTFSVSRIIRKLNSVNWNDLWFVIDESDYQTVQAIDYALNRYDADDYEVVSFNDIVTGALSYLHINELTHVTKTHVATVLTNLTN